VREVLWSTPSSRLLDSVLQHDQPLYAGKVATNALRQLYDYNRPLTYPNRATQSLKQNELEEELTALCAFPVRSGMAPLPSSVLVYKQQFNTGFKWRH
jgi:hypothetical protein